MVLDAFPLTANQKIDRARLPEPAWREQHGASAPPRTGTERLLLQIWQEVLGRDVLRIDRNFFEAGGTSVHLIDIANRAGKLLQRKLGVVSFFEHPTIESMARFIDEQGAAAAPAEGRVKREKGRLAQLRARRK
jgi:fengycin family lipopeptide synthetase B